MAGVAVGVCALTSIMSVEHAWRRAVTRFFAPLDLEMVRVGIPGGIDWREAGFRRPDLDQSDAEAMLRQCPAVRAATCMAAGLLRTEGDAGGMAMTTYAVAADFTSALPDEVKEGRLFTAEEVARQAPVCVLSFSARVQLLGDGPALGRHVRLGGRRLEVVGVIAGNRHVGVEPCAVYIPETWVRTGLWSRFAERQGTVCFARTRDPRAAVRQIERLMKERIGGDGSQPFTSSLWQMREAALHARERATAYGGLAGLCALLAAGIGIASLLFVSVAERSWEIGIHRALGASRLRIYAEYLLAAALLSGTGALVGALAGIPAAAAGAFVTRWQPVLDPLAGEILVDGGRKLPRLSEIAPSVSWQAVAVSALLALVVGAVATKVPASEAASLSPASAIARRRGGQRGSRQVLTCLQVALGVVVLVVLTSWFALLDREDRAEARRALGQDTVFAAADPICALREPADQAYIDGCKDALARALSTPEAVARLQQRTPLLTDVVVSVPLTLSAGHAGRTLTEPPVIFTTGAAFLSDPEMDSAARQRAVKAFGDGEQAAVLGADVTGILFPRQEAVGQSLVIAGKKFTVVAVRPTSGIFVPITHYPALRPRGSLDVRPRWGPPRVAARPIDVRRHVEALAQLRDALLPMLPTEYRKGILFSEQIPETTTQFVFQSAAIAWRGAIGALAVLLVALIGLANMLLVSVHDELRETGVRRALGAGRPDIFLHFVSQGVLLSALGAGAGLAIGVAVCAATRSWVGMPVTVAVFWAVAGAVVTVVAGTLTSIAPALLATRIHPVEAFRHQ
jgi:putative ABC transport system permease protein